jgi:hypothetical protein
MKDNGEDNAFNITTLTYVRESNFKNILLIGDFVDDVRDINMTMVTIQSKINMIKRVLKDKMNVLRSFKKVEKINVNESEFLIDNEDRKKNVIKNYVYHTKNDIINRMKDLVDNHYSIETLNHIGVNIMHIDEIMKMSNQQLDEYYEMMIKKIEGKIIAWIELCETYVAIENKYVKCCDCISKKNKYVIE